MISSKLKPVKWIDSKIQRFVSFNRRCATVRRHKYIDFYFRYNVSLHVQWVRRMTNNFFVDKLIKIAVQKMQSSLIVEVHPLRNVNHIDRIHDCWYSVKDFV